MLAARTQHFWKLSLKVSNEHILLLIVRDLTYAKITEYFLMAFWICILQ